MRLGNFSVSLAVKDIAKSREFYETLCHKEKSTIGLVQGMFSKNTLTFDPGWDRSGTPLPELYPVARTPYLGVFQQTGGRDGCTTAVQSGV